MDAIKKILVATDFSSCSQEAVAYALSLARQLDATILLTHVLEPIDYPIVLTTTEWSESDLLTGSRKLDYVAQPFRQNGIPIETNLVQGHPAERILTEAKEKECDLIVMGTHGRSGMAHFLMGSVAERVVRTASIPVMTVRQREEKAAETIPQKEGEATAVLPEGGGIII